MEVSLEYKQTEVGIIPNDWEVEKLRDVAIIVTGSTPPTSDASNYGDQFMFVSPADMGDTKMIVETEKRLSKKGFSICRRFPKDSILFVCIGSTIGKCGMASTELTSNQQINAIFPSERFCAEYLYYAVSAAAPRVRALAGEQAVPLVNKSQFSETPISFPPLREQRAIATALSDVDALLDALDRLISKKRDLKQAAMQQLLTGKTRLPGFRDRWKVTRLGSVMRFQVGYPFSSVYFNEKEQGVRLIKNRDLKSDDQVFYYSGIYDPSFLVRDGDVLVGMDGDFVPCRWTKGPALLNQRVGRVVPTVHLDIVFAYYFLGNPLKEIEMATAATTVKHLSHGDIEDIQKALPSVSEQAAIATVLSDMDAELTALEARRDKTRALKQGMMQELLTGRIRLVKPEPVEPEAAYA